MQIFEDVKMFVSSEPTRKDRGEVFLNTFKAQIMSIGGNKKCTALYQKFPKKNGTVCVETDSDIKKGDVLQGNFELREKGNVQNNFLFSNDVMCVVPIKSDKELAKFLHSRANGLVKGFGIKKWEEFIDRVGMQAIIDSEVNEELIVKVLGISSEKATSIERVLRWNILDIKEISKLQSQLFLESNEAKRIVARATDSELENIYSNLFNLMYKFKFSFKRCDDIYNKLPERSDKLVIHRFEAFVYHILIEFLSENGGYYVSREMLVNRCQAEFRQLKDNMSKLFELYPKFHVNTVIQQLVNADLFSIFGADVDNCSRIETLFEGSTLISDEVYFENPFDENDTNSLPIIVESDPFDIYRSEELSVNEKDFVTLNTLKLIEDNLARIVVDKLSINHSKIVIDSSILMSQLNDEQKESVIMSLNSPISIITGGPGTGKSTTVKSIIEAFEYYLPETKVTLLAPTGKAAKRLTETTGQKASTIHSKLEIFEESDNIQKKVFEAGDVLIVDEVSMVSTNLMLKLLNAADRSTKIILIGDSDQLPSIEYGACLRDLIKSELIPHVHLEKVYRQAEGSKIVDLASSVKRSESTIKLIAEESTDIRLIETLSEYDIVDDVVKEVEKQKSEGKTSDQVMVLTPYNDGVLGKKSLNECLQKIWNENVGKPVGLYDSTYAVTFYEGDSIMSRENDKEKGIVNGEIGLVISVKPLTKTLTVQFDDKTIIYEEGELNKLDLAYAYTIHKSQGSEADTVVLVSSCRDKTFATRELNYTAVTRAKKELVIIGNIDAFIESNQSSALEQRITFLSEKIIEENKQIEDMNKDFVRIHLSETI